MSKCKATIRRRAQRVGCWRELKARREQLKDAGLDAEQAWKTAAAEIFALHSSSDGDDAESSPLPPGMLANLLVDRRRFEALTGSTRKVVEWVAQNLACADVGPETCPCPEAWALLHWVRDPLHTQNQRDFWTSIYPKLMPSRSELNDAERFRDDGSALDHTILQAIETAKLEAQAKQAIHEN